MILFAGACLIHCEVCWNCIPGFVIKLMKLDEKFSVSNYAFGRLKLKARLLHLSV